MNTDDGKIKPVSRTTLVDEIFEQFLTLIINGDLAPGEKLPPERELAEKLGVGRPSTREALRALSMMGVLDARPGEGTFVTNAPIESFLSPFILSMRITKENSLEIIEARTTLELKLATLAAERASQEDKDLIRQRFDNMLINIDHFERALIEDWHWHWAYF